MLVRFFHAFFSLLAIVALLATSSVAQTPPKPTPTSSPKDEALKQLRALRNDPPQYVEAAIKFLNDFPDAFENESSPSYWVRDAIKKAGNTKEATRQFINRFIDSISTLPAPRRVRFYSDCVKTFLTNDLPEDAVALALKGVPLLDEKEYVGLERERYERYEAYRKERNPESKPREFSAVEQAERFRSFKAAFYCSMGTGYLKRDRLEQAVQTFRQAHAIRPDMESASGIAEILERQGKIDDAFEFMTFAALTGKLKPDGIERFHKLYRQLHHGKLDGVEEFLDTRYRTKQHNPLKAEKYHPTTARTRRVVVAEMFTGGGCIPCIPVDYSLDAALTEYSREQFVLLVYHMHAPVSDPLANHSSEARQKYYGINSAPTVLLDGARFENEVDPRTVDFAVTKSQVVHKALTAAINPRLEVAPKGQLELKAQREGDLVKVTVTASDIRDASPDLTLHIALVEEEVSYSGENGLRFHPMVVRNLARADTATSEYGFSVTATGASSYQHTFDIKRIIAENLRYYDEYPVERKKELSARLDKETLDSLTFSFREQKHVIDPNDLSVAAFLQDNKTREILQSAFLRLSPSKLKNVAATQ